MPVSHARAFDGGLFVTMMVFENAGDVVETHAHTYDHCLAMSFGGLKVESETGVDYFTKPGLIWIKRGVEHRLVATQSNTVAMCMHACRKDGVVIMPDEAAKMSSFEILQATGQL